MMCSRVRSNGQEFQQLVLSLAFTEVGFGAYPDDLDHQGSDQIISLMKQRSVGQQWTPKFR